MINSLRGPAVDILRLIFVKALSGEMGPISKSCLSPERFSTLILCNKALTLYEAEHVDCCPFCNLLLANVGREFTDLVAALLCEDVQIVECEMPFSDEQIHKYWQDLLPEKTEIKLLKHIATCDYCLLRHALIGMEYPSECSSDERS